MAYVQSWANAIKDAPNRLFAAIRDANQISDYLIMNGEFLPQQMPEQAMQSFLQPTGRPEQTMTVAPVSEAPQPPLPPQPDIDFEP